MVGNLESLIFIQIGIDIGLFVVVTEGYNFKEQFDFLKQKYLEYIIIF